MLTADELTALRATAAETLTETVLVKRAVLTSDGAGGQTATWPATTVTTTGRLAPSRSPVEIALAERVAAVQGWTVTLPQGTDARARDRLYVGARVFEVLGVLAAETFETARRCVCVEIL